MCQCASSTRHFQQCGPPEARPLLVDLSFGISRGKMVYEDVAG